MAKKHRRLGSRTPSLPVRTSRDLSAVAALIQAGRYPEARDRLEELDRARPDQPEVLAALVGVYAELGDLGRLQHTAERLLRRQPDQPDLLLSLGGSYLLTMHPALALQSLRRFLARWPDHPGAPQVRQTVAALEARLPEVLADLGLAGDDAFGLAVLHEQAHAALEAGDLAQSQRLLEHLLRQRPDFIPGLNNLSQLYALSGQLPEAIAAAQQVLARDPQNVHALGNLTRYCCLADRWEEARAIAARLKAAPGGRPEVWTKQAEALSYLGDDEGVLEVFRSAERAGALRGDAADPWLYHLAGVAALRLGKRDEARRRWQRALKLDPDFALAQHNLDDLKQPEGERHGPWPYVMGQWLPDRVRQDLAAAIKPLTTRARVSADQVLEGFVRQHPEVSAVIPALLDRGDPVGREFAFTIATMLRTPALLAALRDFALGQRGPDAMRQKAAVIARRGGLLPSGPVRLWFRGEWRAIIPMDFEITDEPVERRRPAVQRLAEQGHNALVEGKAAEAEQALTQALAAEPESPDLLNNLAVAYQLLGRTQEAEALVRRTHERFPDYLFARTSLARLHIRQKEFEAARALLDPLLEREQLHVSEFSALCEAQVEFFYQQGQYAAAESWLDLWAEFAPDHRSLEQWRMMVRLAGGFQRLTARGRRRK